MTTHQPSEPQSRPTAPRARPARTHVVFAALTASLVVCAAPHAQAQSPNPLQLLQGLVNQGQGGSAAKAGAGGVPADELIRLLSESSTEIDEAREIEIGRQLAAVLLGSKPLLSDLATQRYVNQLGRWITLHSTRPGLPWSFAVIDDSGYNAFATPGGYIFITRGLLERVADEAELAGILAHEIAHVTERHHLRAIRKSAQSGLLLQLVGSQLRQDMGGALSGQLLALGRNLYGRGLDRQDEFEADRLGVELASRAGFDPYGLVAALQQLRTAPPEDPIFALTFSTHPPADARLELLAQSMERRLDALSGRPSVPVAQRVARFGQIANTPSPERATNVRTTNPRATNPRPGQPAPKANSATGKP